MSSSISLYAVDAIIVMDIQNSTPIYAKYYSRSATETPSSAKPAFPTVKSQQDFERNLSEKTSETGAADVILCDDRVVAFKSDADVMYLVVGAPHENEILLYNVAVALKETLAILLKYAHSPAAFASEKFSQTSHITDQYPE